MNSRSTRYWLIVILLLSVLLRVSVALLMGDRVVELPGIQDQISYDALALRLLDGHGYSFSTGWYPFTPANAPTSHWSFLYPAYLAAVYGVFGYHPLIARLIQAVMAGVLMPWLTYRLGARFFSQRAALWGAAGTAFYGYFIYHNAALMTETFYLIAILAVFNLTYHMVESRDTQRWWLLGPVMAAAVLLRQEFLFFVPVVVAWLGWIGRAWESGWRVHLRLVLMLLIVIMSIAPWTLRNTARFGRFLMLNSNSGYALFTSLNPHHGNGWDPDYTAPIPADLVGENEAQMDHALTSRGVAFALAEPDRVLRQVLVKLPYHFRFWPTPESGLISNVTRLVSFGFYLPFMVAGLWIARRDWRQFALIYLFALIFIGIHVLTWPGPRYRFAVDALMMPFAGMAAKRSIGRVLDSRSSSKEPVCHPPYGR